MKNIVTFLMIFAAITTSLFSQQKGNFVTTIDFGSSSRENDWNECCNFILDAEFPPGKVQLISPEDGAIEEDTVVAFKWNKIPDTDEYVFHLINPETNEVLLEANLEDTTYTAHILVPPYTYEWFVTAINDAGSGESSDAWSFTIKSDAPDEPVQLLEPEDEAKDQPVNVRLKWIVDLKATAYHVQVFEDTQSLLIFEDDSVTNAGDATAWADPENLVPSRHYKWKVRARNVSGFGPWSETWRFQTVPPPPETAPRLLFPEDSAKHTDLEPTFRWEIVNMAASYRFQLERQDGWLEIDDDEIPNDSKTLIEYNVDNLEDSTTYQWRVQAVNAGGDGPWSEYWTFTTQEPLSVDQDRNNISTSYASPNPAENSVTLNHNISEPGNIKFAIYDYSGNKVASFGRQVAVSGNYHEKINTGNLSEGIYFYSIRMNNKIEYGSFVVLR